MKRIFVLAFVLLCTVVVSAQIRIVDNFDGATALDLNEHADKDVSALVKMGVLDLEVHKEGFYVFCSSDLPILLEHDFKITIKLIVPKIDEKNQFGILFDMDEDFNRLAFVFQEDKFIACPYNRGRFMDEMGEELKIKLPKARNKNMEVVIERKGGKIIVSYDNMEVLRWKRQLNSPYLGFVTSSHLKVDEVIIEQAYTGGEM